MGEFIIKELDSEKDSELLFQIVKHEDEVFQEASVGNFNIKPFAKYGKVFAMIHKEGKIEELVSVIEVLRSFDGGKGYLYGVSAVPKYEKQGHTRKLLEYVVKYLSANNINVIELTVGVNNERAIRLYKKSWFKAEKILNDEYKDGEKRYLMKYENKNLIK